MTARGRSFWIAVSAAAALLIVVAAWFLAISPQLSAASEASDQAEALQVTNQAQRASIAKLEQEQPEPLRAELAAAATGLPDSADLPALTRQLTQQAQQSGVTVDSIAVGTPTTVGGTDPAAASTAGTLLSVPITVSSTGVGANQRAYLKAIQQGPRRALMTTVQVTPKGGDDGTISGKSAMTATLTVYVAPLEAAASERLDALLAGGAG